MGLGGGGLSGYQQGPLRTGELLIYPKGWEAPNFCLPSSTPLPPSFTFLGICRAPMGAPGVLRARPPAGWCKQAQSEMGGRGRVVRGVGAPPPGRRRLGQPLRRPLLLPGQKSPSRRPRPTPPVLLGAPCPGGGRSHGAPALHEAAESGQAVQARGHGADGGALRPAAETAVRGRVAVAAAPSRR